MRNKFLPLLVSLGMHVGAGVVLAESPYDDLLDLPADMPPLVKKSVEEDLKTLASCKFKETTPLFKEIFPLGDDKTLNPKWFKDRVTKIKASSRLNSDAAFALGFHISFSKPICGKNTKPDTLTLGRYYFGGRPAERVGILIHEARHADGCHHRKLPSHYKSPDSLTDGQCDEYYYGSYGSQMIFLVNYARNCAADDMEKNLLMHDAYTMFKYILNEPDRAKLLNDLFTPEEILEACRPISILSIINSQNNFCLGH